MWNQCGMSRNAKGLTQAIADIQALREEFEKDVCVPDGGDRYNPELDKAGRVSDLLELGELMCKDALERKESCGGHFREEFQTAEGEALRDDAGSCSRECVGFTGVPQKPTITKRS